jgi:heat shock protein HslJ
MSNMLLAVSLVLWASTTGAQQPVPAPVQIPSGPSSPGPSRAAAQPPQGLWQWQQSQRGDGTSTTPTDPSRYTIEFGPGGSLAIQADCNQVLGTYAASGSGFTLQLGASTLVGCPPDSVADDFTRDLAKVTGSELASDQLALLLGPTGGHMTFSPLPPADLVGQQWRLQSFNNGRNAVESVMLGTVVTASFGPNDMVSGSSGCNQYFGPYTRSGDSLMVGPLATTRMACDPPIMAQEAAYLAALQAATVLSIRADQLWLRDANGAIQAIFVTSS